MSSKIQSIINCQNPKEADVILIGANYDITSSFGKGANLGPSAIVNCLHSQVEFYDRFTGVSPAEEAKIAYHDLGDINHLSPEDMVQSLNYAYASHAGKNKFVITIGGEHSITNGPLKAIADSEDPKNITVVQIDAHPDLRDTDADFNETPFGKYSHACVMRRARELGYDLVQIGVRTYSKEESDYIRDQKITAFEWGLGHTYEARRIVDAIPTEKVYLTIDIDGIDPIHMPATGTPVQGGLEWSYLFELLGELFKKKDVIGADIVETAPRPGDTLTEYGAALITNNLIANKVLKEKTSPRPEKLTGPSVVGKPVTESKSLREIFEGSLPAFGGAYLRRVYSILREAIANNVPLVVTVAGPITVSDQHRAWLIPFLETGWVAYITVTDAICYHDGHDSLKKNPERPINEVDLFGDDKAYRDAGIIRVTNTGFKEEVLFDQDKMISSVLRQPEFQKKMTTTERNYLLGKYYEAQENSLGIKPGLLSTCYKFGIPVFIGAAADGSVFLNSVKLWALQKISGVVNYKFDYDLHADVFESCAYHYWGLFNSEAKALGALILGGGVPKNYSLQPEPTLSQIFVLDGIRGYDYDVQIVSAPVTDGSLSSCFPAEAVSWGKVNAETYRQKTESMQADYSMVMPFIVKALLDDPELPRRPQLDLYHKREELTADLLQAVEKNKGEIEKTLHFPLKLVEKASEPEQPFDLM